MKNIRIVLFVSLSLSWTFSAFSQRGKSGTPALAGANNVVNEYTTLTVNAVAGATTITVASNTLNANNRFGAGNVLAPGDLVLIIQMQGATILGTPPTMWDPFSEPRDSTWGGITAYNECGNWEFAEVKSVAAGTDITVDCPIKYDYTVTGRTQVIRVPRYLSLTLNAGVSIACDLWNGSTGGVCAIEVQNNTTINGSINVSGRGFRGGAVHSAASAYGVGEAASLDPINGAEKGEGIAGFQADYDQFGGRYCNGAPANGGGGGNAHNAAGAGGANGGVVAAWNGHGNPDNTGAGWTTAWNLHYAGFSANTSSGGGQGGYSFSNSLQDPTLLGPGGAAWVGDQRRKTGGVGGRPLDYSTGKLFLGGGGGAGDQDNGFAGAGGTGGALIYLMNYGTVSGTGQIISNGNAGANAPGKDAAGGAGAGGTIVVNAVVSIANTLSISANGGIGGNQAIGFGSEAEGPGGGGGGGYIAISATGAPTRTANGGANGTTNSNALTKFPPNGATKGGAGTTNATVTNFVINAANTTICAGQSATLTATLGGTPPGGTSIIWYDAIVAGNILFTGSPYITPVLGVGSYTYYVGTCPGTYHQPVVVTVSNTPLVSAGTDATICNPGSTTLSASGGTAYVWSPTTGLSNANISNPVANPASTTTYVVTVTTPCGPGNDTVVVSVISSIVAGISGNTSICTGGTTTLTGSGGTNYSWSTSATTTSIIVSPTTTTAYSLTVSNGNCSSVTTTTVTVTGGVNASISGATTLCSGNTITLTGSGGTNYSWSTSATTTSISVAPTGTTSYSLTVSNGSCSSVATTTVTVTNSPNASINGPTAICTGNSITLIGSGGGNYSWSTTATTSAITVAPTVTTSYSLTVSNGSCSSVATTTVTVSNGVNASINGPTAICTGSSATLVASGGTNYSWTTGATTPSIVITPTSATTYSVFVTSGTCADTASISVTIGSSINPTVTGNNKLCGGGSTTLTASGGTGYLWNGGNTNAVIVVSPTSTTTYSVTVSSGSCAGTAAYTVSVSPTLNVNMSSVAIQCGSQSGTASANPTGGITPYTYLWNNGQTTSQATGLNAGGAYTVTVSDALGCSLTTTVNVVALNAPFVGITGNTNLCTGDAATLTATGGNSYSWSTGNTTTTITIFPTVTTTYTVQATIGNCLDTAVFTVSVSPPPVAGAAGSTTICAGQTATLSASGGAVYSWSNAATSSVITVSPTTSTTYSVIVSIGSCSDTASASVNVLPVPTPSITGTALICGGDVTTLTATGGGTYAWSSGQVTSAIVVTPPSTTTYTVTVSNGVCSSTSTITVTVMPPPNAVITGNNNLCLGNTATLTASGGITYSWSSGQTTSVINPTTSGTYSVIVTTGSCTDTAASTVTFNPNPTATVNPPITIIQGQSANLIAGGGTTYVWDNGMNGGNIVVSPLSTTKYCVTVYDANNCLDTACTTVIVELCSSAGPLYLPNAFSPNGDNENDNLQLYYGITECIKSLHLVIFNRWGEKVFETNDPLFKWNGVYSKNLFRSRQTEGTEVFIYYMDVEIMDGTSVSRKGNISLIR